MSVNSDVGGRHGAGEYNPQLAKLSRANRISHLKMSDVNLDNDPYLMRNQNGLLECKLCCTTHKTEASYLNHTYGKTHQRNLERRRVCEARKEALMGGARISTQPKPEQKKVVQAKIGNPSFDVHKLKDMQTGNLTILFEIQYPDIKKHTKPKYRIMSPFEQKVEQPNPKYQYLLFAAIPYNTISFKIPNMPVIEDQIIEDWKNQEKKYVFQITLSKPALD